MHNKLNFPWEKHKTLESFLDPSREIYKPQSEAKGFGNLHHLSTITFWTAFLADPNFILFEGIAIRQIFFLNSVVNILFLSFSLQHGFLWVSCLCFFPFHCMLHAHLPWKPGYHSFIPSFILFHAINTYQMSTSAKNVSLFSLITSDATLSYTESRPKSSLQFHP